MLPASFLLYGETEGVSVHVQQRYTYLEARKASQESNEGH